MTRTWFFIGVSALAPILLSPAMLPKDYSHYQGRRVMTITWNTEARKQEAVVRTLELGKVYEVTKVDGRLLWFNEAVGGWIDAADVVLYEDAIDHFNRLVQEDASADNFRNRAAAWMAKGELDNAIGDFNKASTTRRLRTTTKP